jgi:hypothetical protein
MPLSFQFSFIGGVLSQENDRKVVNVPNFEIHSFSSPLRTNPKAAKPRRNLTNT